MTFEQIEMLLQETPYLGLSCVKDANNFYFTSNHALFSMDAAESEEEALAIMQEDAKRLAAKGYTIEWQKDVV
jgi:hypothetical protein